MLKIHKAGFYTTVQDLGRFGFREKGVPVAGAMDLLAHQQANQLLRNSADSATLEITMLGPALEFLEDTHIVISGASFSITLNDDPIENMVVYSVKKGSFLKFGKLQSGLRAYLAIKGGFQTELVLNSRSFYHPITKFRIENGDVLPFSPSPEFEPLITEWKVPNTENEIKLRAYKGVEFDLFTPNEIEKLLNTKFTISNNSNRMGYQFNESIGENTHSIITSSVIPGTVQCTPSGNLIALMRDAQTTGGYPRILQLTEQSINILAQKKTGNQIKFSLID